MLKTLRLTHYKGFNEFTATFGSSALLVGPNNAGKTTLVAALRICALLLAYAKRRNPDQWRQDPVSGRQVRAYPLALPGGRFAFENLRHEFREAETRVVLTFANGAKLCAVWPIESEGDPFFYLEHAEGLQPRSISVVRDNYTSIGIVPTLTPIEREEKVLSEEHIEANLGTRLVSKHFRNQLHYLRQDSPARYEEFVQYLLANTPEIEALTLIDSYPGGNHVLDLYVREASSHSEKELYWIGDGMQIWAQVLYHLWRQRDCQTIVLDEPDVFLHPDLQRRMVRLLEDEFSQQIIMATHAPEMLTEAARETVVIVDRTQRHSRRVADERVLSNLNDTLGSGFNLRLARALRSRLVLFVEGDDMKVLLNLAKTLHADRFLREQGLTVVPLLGFSKWRSTEAYAWLNSVFLDNAVKMYVVLDRDYRTNETIHDLQQSLRDSGVYSHVWELKELESYLMVPSAMARIAGVATDVLVEYLDEAVESLRTAVFARYLEERHSLEVAAQQHGVNVIERYTTLFNQTWAIEDARLAMVPPKEVLSLINQRLQASGAKPRSTV